MKYARLLLVLLVFSACDRRDDPSVDPASTGSSTPPGERVDSGTDSRVEAEALAPAPEGAIPVSTQPPPAVPQCDGKVGDALANCLRDQRDANAPPSTPSR